MGLVITYLHIVSATIYAILAIVVLRLDIRSWHNRISFLLLMSFSLWSACYGVVSNPHVSMGSAMLFDTIASIGWAGFPGLFLGFAFLFTGRKKAAIASLAVTFAVQFYFFLLQWTGGLMTGYTLYWHGWMGQYTTLASKLFLVYLTLCLCMGLFLLILYQRTSQDRLKKNQAFLVIVFALASLCLGAFSNAIARIIGLNAVPPLADVIVLIWAAGITYAVSKYQFLGVTTTVAADAIISSLGDALFILLPEGKITFANAPALDLLGYSRQGLEGKNFKDIILSGLSPADIMREIDRLPGHSGGETLFRSKNGKSVPVSVTVSRLPGYGYLCVARDISRQKHIREELRRANERLEEKVADRTAALIAANRELEEKIVQSQTAEEERKKLEGQLFQSQKLESIGQLAGGIAHDFNNFLAAISGFADLIRRDKAQTNERAARYAGKIIDVAAKASAMIGNLLTFARKGAVEMAVLDLHQVLSDSAEILGHTLGKNIVVQTAFKAGSPFMYGDRAQLQNAFINLAVNARDAMPGGGTLSIETRETLLDQAFAKSKPYTVVAGTYVQVTVRDTGTGMDAKTMARIFEPFFTTKEKGKGTGLGLSSVYGTVKGHGGYIDVESALGTGTAFHLYFPQAANDTAAPAAPEATEAAAAVSGTVLVVDDEKYIRDICGEVLSGMGCNVVYASNGSEAVEVYQAMKGSIDLVLLDMMMPKMNGDACFRKLKELDPEVKVLIVSGYAHSDEIQQSLQQGALGFVQKPFVIDTLTAAIGEIMGKPRKPLP